MGVLGERRVICDLRRTSKYAGPKSLQTTILIFKNTDASHTHARLNCLSDLDGVKRALRRRSIYESVVARAEIVRLPPELRQPVKTLFAGR
jgi:hypothetical protein